MYTTFSTGNIADRPKADDNAGWIQSLAEAVADYFEGCEEDTGESMELDTVAMRREFSEGDITMNSKLYEVKNPWTNSRSWMTEEQISGEILRTCENSEEVWDEVIDNINDPEALGKLLNR